MSKPIAVKLPKNSKKPKLHGWEGMKGGKPPFPGAAPPIHRISNGKYLKKKVSK